MILHARHTPSHKLCIYTASRETGQLFPKPLPANPEFVTDTAPIDRWDVDIMTLDGEQRLRGVVAEVKTMYAQLSVSSIQTMSIREFD